MISVDSSSAAGLPNAPVYLTRPVRTERITGGMLDICHCHCVLRSSSQNLLTRNFVVNRHEIRKYIEGL